MITIILAIKLLSIPTSDFAFSLGQIGIFFLIKHDQEIGIFLKNLFAALSANLRS